MSVVLAVVAALTGAVLLRALTLVLEKEYGTWAGSLARLLIRVAGLIYRRRQDQWFADLVYFQREEKQSGLLESAWCLASAPWLLLRDARRERRSHKANPTDLPTDVLEGTPVNPLDHLRRLPIEE